MSKIRRHVAGGALALMTALGVLTTAGSPAAQAAEVFAATDKPTSAALSAAETSAAAQSMTSATTICETQIKPRALQFHTVYEWQFPACAVAVHLCADEAFTNGKLRPGAHLRRRLRLRHLVGEPRVPALVTCIADLSRPRRTPRDRVSRLGPEPRTFTESEECTMSSNAPELNIAGRRLRASVTWWLALALVLAMAHLVHSPAPAIAEEACFLDEAGSLTCPDA